MKSAKIVFAAAVLVLAGVSASQAATVKGRITMLDDKNRRLTVDNNEVYSVAPAVDLSGLAVGAPAQLNVSGAGVVTAAKRSG